MIERLFKLRSTKKGETHFIGNWETEKRADFGIMHGRLHAGKPMIPGIILAYDAGQVSAAVTVSFARPG